MKPVNIFGLNFWCNKDKKITPVVYTYDFLVDLTQSKSDLIENVWMYKTLLLQKQITCNGTVLHIKTLYTTVDGSTHNLPIHNRGTDLKKVSWSWQIALMS